MGIMDFFRTKKNEVNQEQAVDEVVLSKQNDFVANLSTFELEEANWTEFATLLKQNKVLPNSYEKQPISVEVVIDKKNRPKVIIEFKSSTSNSVRKFSLLQDGAFQYVNGAIDDGKDNKLQDLWKAFQDEIRYRNKLKTNREGYFHMYRGRKLAKVAEKQQAMYDIYDREQEFLEKYSDVKFDDFSYSNFGEVPMFNPLIMCEDGTVIEGDGVVPFTPRTLELCILGLTDGAQIEAGQYVDGFERMCRTIADASCFESEDWDKVIGFGAKIVQKKYQESELSDLLIN